MWLPEAQRGDPRAQFYLSRLYSEGLGAMASRQEAFEWLSRSAQGGFAPAQYSKSVAPGNRPRLTLLH
ncbi:MAG: hypothetical protein AB2814_08090 [Candidatus Sedimenticola endophacoides]